MCGMLEAAIDGNLERGSKRPHQQRLDREKAKLSGFLGVAVAPNVRLISPGLHEEWSKEISEIGRLLGGWMAKTARIAHIEKEYAAGYIDVENVNATMQSYFGDMKHFDSDGIRTKLTDSTVFQRGRK